MQKNKLVTIIIPTFNRADRIKKSVLSVLNQTYDNIELIVVDDGSTDDTQDVLSTIKDSRLRVIIQSNQGACVARNNGIKNAQGEYIAFNDSDDTWMNDKLQKQVAMLEKNNVDIVFCKEMNVTEGINDITPYNYSEGIMYPVNNVFGIGTPTVLGKKSIFLENMFDDKMPRLQDADLLIRLAQKYKFYCLDEPLVRYKVWDDSISNNPIKLEIAIKRILNKYPNLDKDLPRFYEDLEKATYITAIKSLKKKDKKFAKKFLELTLSFKSSKHKEVIKIIRNKILIINIGLIHRIYSR